MCFKWFKPKPKPPVPPVPPVPPIPPLPPDPPPAPKQDVYVGVYDLLGATGDWKAYLKKVKDAGGKGVRFFICYSWQGPQPISPYLQVGTWTHENGITFPLYRLGAHNLYFWTHLDEVLAECKSLDLVAWVVIEDYCSIKGDQRVKYYNPFCSSEEALGPTTPDGVWGDSLWPYHVGLYNTVADHVKRSGAKYLVEDMNEGDCLDWNNAFMLNWFIRSNAQLKLSGFLQSEIVTTVARNVHQIAQKCGLHSPHQIGTHEQIVATGVLGPRETIYSSDGWKKGSGFGGGVGAAEAVEIGNEMNNIGAKAFELLPRECYADNNDRANVDLYNPAATEAMAFSE